MYSAACRACWFSPPAKAIGVAAISVVGAQADIAPANAVIRRITVFIVFPVDISTHDLVFLFEDRQTLGTFKLSLQSPAGIVVGQIEVTRENISKDNESELGRLSPWKLASCNCKGISITEPGEYKVGMDVNANSYGLVVSFFTTKNMVLLPQKK